MTQREMAARCTLEQVASVENLFEAAARARRGKSRRAEVEAWWLRRESEIAALRAELLGGGYSPGPYRLFEIHEPKRRMIAAAPFRDRVVHHALCLRLAPLMERRFIERSFSCRVGKGTTAARECCRRLVNRHRHVLKCDIRKFFASLDHGVLLAALGRLVRCPGAMELIRRILAGYRAETPSVAGEEPGRPRGVPIGNLISQWWGNFTLDGLDHWITETQAHGDYLRYTDDLLLFGDDKVRLWELRAGIEAELAAIRLRLAETKTRVYATGEGVPFCGFRFFPGRRPRILGATKRRFERRMRRLARRRAFGEMSLGVASWYAFSREGNSEGLRRAYGRGFAQIHG